MERKQGKQEGAEKEILTTTVKVFGVEYPISSPEDPAYTRRVADYVDKKMREIAQQSLLDQSRLAVLVAMDIADELLTLRRKRYAIIGRTGTAAEKLARTVTAESQQDRRNSAPPKEE